MRAMNDGESVYWWRIRRSNGMTGAHFHATAPGCPMVGHAIRDCRCRVFRTADEAHRYIAGEATDGLSDAS